MGFTQPISTIQKPTVALRNAGIEPTENERMLAYTKDSRRKGMIGHDTANVLQDLADS